MKPQAVKGKNPFPLRPGTARCCRDWPVDLGTPIRKCGLCGEVPEIVKDK